MPKNEDDLKTEYAAFLERGGVFHPPIKIISVKGKDASDFLHRLTSSNVRDLKEGDGIPAALLQPNASILSLLTIYRLADGYLIAVEEERAQATLEELNKMHFAEALEIIDEAGLSVLSVQGNAEEAKLQALFEKLPSKVHQITIVGAVYLARECDFNAAGIHILGSAQELTSVEKKLEADGIPPCSLALWRYLRLDAWRFELGRDITEKNIILEAPLDEFVSRNKGCYPGQEVVERIFTYGTLSKKLVGVKLTEFESIHSLPQAGARILVDGADVGRLTSVHVIPWSQKIVAFAMIRKPSYEERQKVSFEGSNAKGEVLVLAESFSISKESKS